MSVRPTRRIAPLKPLAPLASLKALSPRPRMVRPGGGDRATVTAFARDYRFWARVPSSVNAVVFLADPQFQFKDKIIAVVGRPKFPPGVCRACGCSEMDACMMSDLLGAPIGCSWTDVTRTRCTACDVAKTSPAALKRTTRVGQPGGGRGR